MFFFIYFIKFKKSTCPFIWNFPTKPHFLEIFIKDTKIKGEYNLDILDSFKSLTINVMNFFLKHF